MIIFDALLTTVIVPGILFVLSNIFLTHGKFILNVDSEGSKTKYAETVIGILLWVWGISLITYNLIRLGFPY